MRVWRRRRRKKEKTQVKIVEWLDNVTKYAQNETWTHSQVIYGLASNDKDQKKSQALDVKLNNLNDRVTEWEEIKVKHLQWLWNKVIQSLSDTVMNVKCS